MAKATTSKTTMLSVRLPNDLYARLVARCDTNRATMGMTVSALLERALGPVILPELAQGPPVVTVEVRRRRLAEIAQHPKVAPTVPVLDESKLALVAPEKPPPRPVGAPVEPFFRGGQKPKKGRGKS